MVLLLLKGTPSFLAFFAHTILVWPGLQKFCGVSAHHPLLLHLSQEKQQDPLHDQSRSMLVVSSFCSTESATTYSAVLSELLQMILH